MLGQFFGFEGRLGRGSWWLGQIFAGVLVALAFGLLAIVAGPNSNPFMKIAVSLMSLAGSIASMVVSVCVTVKRYHDRDKSGFWWFIGLVPIIGFWQIIECGFCSGDDGDNRFGSPPGSEQRRADLGKEISALAASNGKLAKDDNYSADYAKNLMQKNLPPTSSFGQSSGAKPAFGKR